MDSQTVYNQDTGVSYFQDKHGGRWYVDLPSDAVEEDVNAALILMQMQSPNILLEFRVQARPDNTVQIVMQLPNDMDPSVFFPPDDAVLFVEVVELMAVRAREAEAARSESQTAAAPADGRLSPVEVDNDDASPAPSVGEPPINNAPSLALPSARASNTTTARQATHSPSIDIPSLANSPALLSDPRRLSGPLDAHQIRCLATTFNEMVIVEPTTPLITAIIYLEASNWLSSLALQDFHFSQIALHWPRASFSKQNLHNEKVDRMPALAGHAFDPSKLEIIVKKKSNFIKKWSFDSFPINNKKFDPFNLRHVLLLNRQRWEFLTSSIGTQPLNSRGSALWHPLEKLDVSQRYMMRDKATTPDFPDYKSLTDEHNEAFKNQPLPGWGIIARQRGNVDGEIHRWWLASEKGVGSGQRHKKGQENVRKWKEGLRKKAQEAYEKNKGLFSAGIEDWEAEYREMEREETASYVKSDDEAEDGEGEERDE